MKRKSNPTDRRVPRQADDQAGKKRKNPSSERKRSPGQKNHEQRAAERLAQIEKRKARSRAFSLVILVLFIMVITVFAIIVVMRQAEPSPRFVFLQEGKLERTVTASGLIARDEQIFHAPTDGVLKPLATEGSRAARGQKLALVIPEGREDELIQLQKCERDIIDLQNELMQQGKGAGARAIYDESAVSLASVINLIRNDLTQRELGNLSAYQTALAIILEQRTARLMSIDFNDARLGTLKQTKEALEASLGMDAATLICEKPGIISYKMDGFEGEWTTTTLQSTRVSDIRKQIESSQALLTMPDEIEKDQPVLRITSGLYQGFAFILPGNQTPVFPIDSVHEIKLIDDGVLIEHCQVVRIEKTNEDTLVVFHTDRKIEWLIDRRLIRAELTLERTQGLKVPYSALIDHDEESRMASLMIVVGGFTRICQVRVVDHNQESAIIEALEGETYQPAIATLLVVNPESIEAGEFIGE
jgi:multidrug efflux pump subunit AcrA (membrane-fusion protein)